MTMYDLIIIGGGISGFSAAIYAGRYHLKSLIISELIGGAITLTDTVENFPGFSHISGQELFDRIKDHAMKYDIEVAEEKAAMISKKGPFFTVQTKEGSYESRTILIATGTEWKKLRVPGEEEFAGNGVHYCALCDGFNYKGKTVCVVGGSDSAAKEAMLLTEYADKVYLIYRKEKIRAEPINIKRVTENPKIEIINNTMVMEIKGDKVVDKVVLDKEFNGKKELALDGIFIDIGHIPLSQLVKGIGVGLNEKEEIVINRRSETNVPGVYAAGDVTDKRFKQAITGAADGVNAVYSAYQFLSNK